MHRVTSLFLCDTYYFVHHLIKIKIKNCFFLCTSFTINKMNCLRYFFDRKFFCILFSFDPNYQFNRFFSLIILPYNTEDEMSANGCSNASWKRATIKLSQTIGLFSLAIYFPDFSNITKRSTKSLRDVMTTKNLLCTLLFFQLSVSVTQIH